MTNIDHDLARFLVRHRWWLFWTAMAAAAACWYPASNLSLDRRIENLFAAEDPVLPPHYRLKERFGGNEIVLCVYDDEALWTVDESGMRRLETIRRRLRKVPGVKGVLSIDMPIGKEVVNDHFVSRRIRQLFQSYTHGGDGRTACVACMLHPQEDTSVSREETIRTLRRTMRDLPAGLKPGIITGEPVMIHDAFQYLEADGRRLMVTTTILLAAVILICFQSIRWVVIPILVVQLSLLLTKGMLVLFQVNLTMVSSMLTAVVTVVGIGTVMHVIVRYREELGRGLAPEEALSRTLAALWSPVLWACVTDAIGFGALVAARVAPVREFGFMMALGSLVVLLSCALVIPALTLFGPRDRLTSDNAGDRFLNRRLLDLVKLVERHPLPLALVTIVGSLAASSGAYFLQTETDFTRNFREGTEIVSSYELVESKLGGAGVLDIVIEAPEVLSWPYIRQVLLMEKQLREEVQIKDEDGKTEPGLTKILSLADAIYYAAPRDISKARRLQQVLINTGLTMMRRAIPEFFDALYSAEPDADGKRHLRIMLRARERQPSQQKQAIIDDVTRIATKNFPEAEVTGYFVLLTNLIDSILRDQWRTFGIAVAGIFFVMLIAVRGIKLAIVALIPNVVPIVVVNGLMGWLGFRMNMGAAMIAAVSMGLAIDGAIHYLIALRRAREEGRNLSDALAVVQQSVGRGMTFSVLALVTGFSALATSPFVPTIYFGTLVSVSMFCTLIGTLVWLPLLIRWVDR